MIKFFRQFRQQMIKENRFSKYLLYAIGEIILVIIGILFALQINTWNTERIIQNESESFKTRLLKEVNANVDIIDLQIIRETGQKDSALEILHMFNAERSELKSSVLDSLIYTIMGKNTVHLKLSTFNEGLSSSKISLLKSDSLRELLYGFPAIVERVKGIENVVAEDITFYLTSFLYDHLNWRKMDAGSSVNKDILGVSAFSDYNSLQALNYMKFENLVDNQFFNSDYQLSEYLKLRESLVLLKNMLSE